MSLSAALGIARRYANGGGVNTDPSPAQKEAGNYKKKHIVFQGIPITIENPKGTIRSGLDHKGQPWSSRMTEDYGYIKRTEGHDGDQVDCFVGPNKRSNRVWVVDQLHHSAHRFDEHKCLLGFNTEKQAIGAYRKSYGTVYDIDHAMGAVTEMSVDAFKEWLKGGGGKKPISPDVPQYRDGGSVDIEDVMAKAQEREKEKLRQQYIHGREINPNMFLAARGYDPHGDQPLERGLGSDIGIQVTNDQDDRASYQDGGVVFDPDYLKSKPEKTPNIRVTEGHQEFEKGYAPSGRSPWNTDYPYRPILNMRGQELHALKIQTGGAVDDPPMVSDEDLAQAQINQQAAPREGGLMQTVPQAWEMAQTPEGRGKLWEATKTAASQFIPGMVEQVKGPGEAMAGKMTPEQQADWAAGMGMGLIGASTPFRFAEPSGLGVFGGRNAIGHDAEALSKAEEMKAKGADKDAIHQETGWFEDPHTGKWGFYIPTYTARLTRNLQPHPVYGQEGIVTLPFGKQTTLDNILHMPKLYKMYPWLKEWTVSADHSNFMLDRIGDRGATAPDLKHIELSPAMPPEMLDTLVHEVNHIIQEHEGFSLGGNDDSFLPRDFPYSVHSAMNRRDDLAAELQRRGFQDLQSVFEAMHKQFIQPNHSAMTAMDRAYVKAVERNGLTDEMKDVMTNLWNHHLMQNQAFDNYLTLHGESMSRAAEYLRRIAPDQARSMTPWSVLTQMRQPRMWDQTIYSSHQAPVQWRDIAADAQQPFRFTNAVDRLRQTAQRMEPDPVRRMLSSEDTTEGDLAAAIANKLIETYGHDPAALRARVDRLAENISPDTLEKIKQFIPPNYIEPRPSPTPTTGRMTPGEAIDYIREYTGINNPAEELGYINPKDYVTYAENLRELREGSGGFGRTQASKEAAFKETPLPEFQYKPEELGIGADETYRYETPTPTSSFGRRVTVPTFMEKFNEHISPHMDVDQFYKHYFNGMVKPDHIQTEEWTPDQGFYIDSNLVGHDGNIIGSISRSFNPENKKAYHGYLRLNPDVRGTGLVPNMLKNQIELYQKLGIEKVKLGANIDVGGYAWAKYGFKTDADEWTYYRQMLKNYLDDRKIKTNDNYTMHLLYEIAKDPDPKTMWTLSDIKTPEEQSGVPIGKWFLMHKSWPGVLDLTDNEALERFFKYVKEKSRAP